MRMESLKKGMKVLISNDLSITNRRCGANDEMMAMRNKTYIISGVGLNIINICDEYRNSWSFAIEDLLPTELPYQELKTNDLANIKSELFNPKELIGD